MKRLAETLGAVVARRDAPGGAAILFSGQEILWSGVEGVRDASSASPLLLSSKARVASISKVATALTVLKLVEAGQIDLDRDISDVLGFKLRHPKFPDSPITPRMILCHTAGIRDGESYRGVVGETLEGFFVPAGKNWNNGKHWADLPQPFGYFTYSNLAMGLLAQACENAGGDRFDRLAQKLVFSPLGIECGFNWSGISDQAAAEAATLYRRKTEGDWEVQVDGSPATLPRPNIATDPGLSLSDYVLGRNGLLFSPQGGLRASVTDLARFGMALSGVEPLLDPATRALVLTPQWTYRASPPNGDTSGGAFQGFGLGVHRLIPGDQCPVAGLRAEMVGHYGEAYGLLAGLWVDPLSTRGFAWFITGSLYGPPAGLRSGVYRVEEEMMQAAAEDLGLVDL
ncbi:serine hydrolase [Aquidulcibacter sp.]|uniref:serine hydrolase domain-containing protein n=1 Tax=Aquidulcibacter sp. TaxID=2052990 RepID=UPI0025BACB49|nr:serine hydrolase domain-containing protein [Aquidulcibacter sp.]MCA3691866.1 beta-lactamase family protein [Aquidulcibacter sp.]